MRNLKLSSRLFLGIIFAVLVPLVVLGITSFVSVQAVAVDNLEAFLEESGEARQEKIQNDFQTALNLLSEFVNENQSELVQVISPRTGPVISDDPVIRQAENQVENEFQANLISTEYFNSVSLLVRDRTTPFATANLQGQSPLSFPENLENTDADSPEEAALREFQASIASNNEQDLLIMKLNGSWHFMILTAVYDRDITDDSLIAIGFILADLNLDKLILENLAGQTSAYESYAYVILPTTDNTIIATNPELVDINSEGAGRAVADFFGVVSYSVGEESNQRSVLGYTATLTLPFESRKFGLVVEANQASIAGQILQQGGNRIFPITIGSLIISALMFYILSRNIVPPVRRLREAIVAMISGDFEHPIKDANRSDEIGSLATSFSDLREHIRELTEDMNRRLRERTRDVQVTQDIGRAVTAERDLERLMNRVVSLIVQNFPSIYHAQIFLLDEDKQYAVLRASTGQAGRELLSRGHKLGVGSVSVIGQVTEQGQVIIARDIAESSVHRQNEFLGETRAELAIPLRLGNDIIGTLDVQSKLRDSFDEDQVAALQTLADQITIAIENARLYAESARLLASIEQERGASTRSAWKEYMNQERKDSLLVRSGVQTDYEFEKLSIAVLSSGKALVGDATSRNTIPFAVPIVLRGQTLGVVEYEVPQAEFNYDKVLLAEELVARLAISMENARLFQTSQQSAERERIVNSISTKLTGQTDIEEILQTAIREVGQALRTPQVAIRLTAGINGNGSHEETPDPSPQS